MPAKKKPKSVFYTVAEFRKIQAQEVRMLKAKHKRQLKYIKKGRKAEAYFAKHDKWPKWWGRKAPPKR